MFVCVLACNWRSKLLVIRPFCYGLLLWQRRFFSSPYFVVLVQLACSGMAYNYGKLTKEIIGDIFPPPAETLHYFWGWGFRL